MLRVANYLGICVRGVNERIWEMREVVEEVEAEGPSMVAFPWAMTGRGHSPSSAHFQRFSFGWGGAWACLPPKRHGYTGLAACENKWCLLKHSKTGGAGCDEGEIHPDGDGPLQAKPQLVVNAECRALRQSPWGAQVLSSHGANAVQVMQRALPLFPAPLNRPVISFT